VKKPLPASYEVIKIKVVNQTYDPPWENPCPSGRGGGQMMRLMLYLIMMILLWGNFTRL